MTFHPLHCHPGTPAPPQLALQAAFLPEGPDSVRLIYRVEGAPDTLKIPAPQIPEAADGLWQHTCFEAFIAAVDDLADGKFSYREFNFSPSGCWAAYRFTAYRQRDSAWHTDCTPRIAVERTPGVIMLDVSLPRQWLPATPRLRIGLTAVLETQTGEKTYWALHHAGPQPDFHLEASFVLRPSCP